MNFWHHLGRQLGHPTGLAGRMVGNAMRLANRRPNALAIHALEIAPQDEILELGFGPGQAIERMVALAPCGRIYGVDRSAVMLDQARSRNAEAIRSGRVFLKQSDFDQIPLPGASVDKILAVNVIYFWADVAKVVQEVRRVLRPGGLLSIYATDASVMRHWKFAGPETHRLFNGYELAAALRHAGFVRDKIDVIKIRAAPGVPGLIARIKKH
ncbi:MAG: class I SAM-dependent methyltransferase [Alphaproteobacteria bacterium]